VKQTNTLIIFCNNLTQFINLLCQPRTSFQASKVIKVKNMLDWWQQIRRDCI